MTTAPPFPVRGQRAPDYWDDDLKAYIDFADESAFPTFGEKAGRHGGPFPAAKCAVTVSNGTYPGYDGSGPAYSGTNLPLVAQFNGPLQEVSTPGSAFGQMVADAGNGVSKPIDAEFVYTGINCLLWFYANDADMSARIWINDQEAEVGLINIGGVGASPIIRLAFSEYGTYRIRVAGPHYMVAILTNLYEQVHIGAERPWGLVTGDSYGESNGQAYADTVGVILRTHTGCRVRNFAQGGTGPLNNAAGVNGSSEYGSVARKAKYASVPSPRFVFVTGIGNDTNLVSADSVAAAVSLTRWFATVFPGVPVFWMGTQPVTPFRNTNGAARNTAMKAAINAEPNGHFIDAYSDFTPWLTGTGNTGAVVNDGNQSLMIGPDGYHPVDKGGRHYWTNAWERMKAFATRVRITS